MEFGFLLWCCRSRQCILLCGKNTNSCDGSEGGGNIIVGIGDSPAGAVENSRNSVTLSWLLSDQGRLTRISSSWPTRSMGVTMNKEVKAWMFWIGRWSKRHCLMPCFNRMLWTGKQEESSVKWKQSYGIRPGANLTIKENFVISTGQCQCRIFVNPITFQTQYILSCNLEVSQM